MAAVEAGRRIARPPSGSASAPPALGRHRDARRGRGGGAWPRRGRDYRRDPPPSCRARRRLGFDTIQRFFLRHAVTRKKKTAHASGAGSSRRRGATRGLVRGPTRSRPRASDLHRRNLGLHQHTRRRSRRRCGQRQRVSVPHGICTNRLQQPESTRNQSLKLLTLQSGFRELRARRGRRLRTGCRASGRLRENAAAAA